MYYQNNVFWGGYLQYTREKFDQRRENIVEPARCIILVVENCSVFFPILGYANEVFHGFSILEKHTNLGVEIEGEGI